jgi:TRAP-type C4-dicarboxylate transport system substrate-binding protein
MATVAPDGTEYAREFRAFAREVQTGTKDAVTVRWYWGGIAGDEIQARERIERGQLDGIASAGMLCGELSPTMRAMRMGALVQSSAEASYLLGRLRSDLAADFTAGGFESLGTPLLGSNVLYLNQNVSSLAELRKLRIMNWDLDNVGIASLRSIGVRVLPLPLERYNTEMDAGHADGFIGIASGALAFQWLPRTKVIMRLPIGFLAGCLLISQRSWNRLPVEARDILRGAAAKGMVRMSDLMERQDTKLLGGLFQRQGVQVVDPSTDLKAQFYGAVREARGRVSEEIVPRAVFERLQVMLADYRAEHSERGQ